MNKTYYKTLTIAGSDSGGGAGIQADIKTFSALGCYGMSAITALTAQNTKGVTGIHPVPSPFIEKQIDAIFTDMGCDAVKIGMLYSAGLVKSVAGRLKKYRAKNIVLDPVMVAESGDRLLKESAIQAIKEYLIPLADIITPNIPEAEVLTGMIIENPDDMRKAAKNIAGFGAKSILIKGGHFTGNDSTDILFIPAQSRFVDFKGLRIKTKNTHGTGCTLSSAIAAFMAKGDDIEIAVNNAKAYISNAIKAGAEYKLGSGSGPVHHFFGFR